MRGPLEPAEFFFNYLPTKLPIGSFQNYCVNTKAYHVTLLTLR